jgi:hypothetical protein
VHGFPAPESPPTFRNSFVNTQLRRFLCAHYLILDSGTVVRKPLTVQLILQSDIAAAPNHSADTPSAHRFAEA